MIKLIINILIIVLSVGTLPARNEKMMFWDSQKKGANWFNTVPTKDWLIAAKRAGLEVARLAPNKWKTRAKDFLIGDADHYNGIVKEDFTKLKNVLDQADSVGIKIVLTTLSLPGSRWRQQNNNKFDVRLWKDSQYVREAAEFWKELARRLYRHPAVVGYNILNEPIPEVASGIMEGSSSDLVRWHKGIENTTADLNLFNATIIKAIREVDNETPVVIDCGLWAMPNAIGYQMPIQDSAVIYAVHMYEPYEYTNNKTNNGRYSYPGMIEGDSLNIVSLRTILNPIDEWRKRFSIPATRIFISEFGCYRRTKGAVAYLEDLLQIFNQYGWHWAFYSFREDQWDGMDYEMGTRPAGEAYWKAIEKGEAPTPVRHDNALWEVFKNELKE